MMEIITRWWRPSQPEYDPAQFTEDIVYPVHLHDANFAKVLMVCTMRFDSVLDAAKLHSSLTRLLEIGDWKKVGGRLRRNANGKLEIHVPREYSQKRPAVTFSRKDLTMMPIKDHELASKLPVPTDQTSIQPNPYNLVDLGIRGDIPKTLAEMVDRDLPQLSLHIVSFQDATLVSLSWPHSVMGCQGYTDLIQAWSLVLSGNESQVPHYSGANQDELLEIETQEDPSTREELLVQTHRLTGLHLLMFIIRFVLSLRVSRVVKSIFIPKRALERLHDSCKQEVSQTATAAANAESPDEATTLLAWFTRLAASGSSNTKPVTIIRMLSVTRGVSSLLQQAGVNSHNMTMHTFSFLSGAIARGPLGPLIQEHTRHVEEQTTQKQCLSWLRMYRNSTQGGSSFMPFFGPSNAHPVVCNDLGVSDGIRSADFGGALLEPPDTIGDRPPGSMTCYYYHIINSKLGVGLDCIYLLGKDHGENLWVTAALPASTWTKVEAALEDYR